MRAIKTGALTNMRLNLLLRRLQRLSVVDGPVVHETEGNWATGYRATHAVAQMQGRAAPERCIHGVAIDVAHPGRRIMA